MKKPLLFTLSVLLCISSFSQINVDAGPKNEVFRKTDLRIAATRLWDPWEITFFPGAPGTPDSVWVTEAKAYKVSKISTADGGSRTVLDISNGSTFLPLAQRPFNMQYNIGTNNPQGGMMGMAIHPDFYNPTTPKRYIYIAYVHTYDSTKASNGGVFYTNRVVRFTYNLTNNRFDSPVSLCDTLPGSGDHNSGRLLIAPIGGTNYLFYAEGDMGAGQFGNAYRLNKAQNVAAYEGKILRFNLESDGDAGLNAWIPNAGGVHSNPYNGVAQPQSAVWAMGIRNNQGFAYANGRIYGSSHGPFTDDEINVIAAGRNYGHPLVVGDSTDGNYNSAMVGGSASNLPLITNERLNARAMGSAYANAMVSFYAAPGGALVSPANGTVQYIYQQFNGGNQANGAWPSEGISGIDVYTNSMIPGWKNSLIIGCLKGGRVMRMNLDATGTGTLPNNTINDTNTLFRSTNRFRDIAISADGKTIFTVIDSSQTTSGPTTTNPIVSQCRGCLQKYTFLGYNQDGTAASGSMIPTSIPIAQGKANQCENANYVVINAANNNTTIWVPITDTNSNVVAEIYANGNSLDTVWTSIYKNTGTVREDGAHRLYMDRNITIRPKTQPGSAVRIRLYITGAEFTALSTANNSLSQPSGVATISNLGLFKNSNNACGSTVSGGAITPVTITGPTGFKTGFGTGYVLQTSITSFSSFFFANVANTTLPLNMIAFTGKLDHDNTLLNWKTSNEVNTASFEVERSTDGSSFEKVGTVNASGTTSSEINYSYTDPSVSSLSSPILYYRLKIIDIDGAFSYSNVVTVSLADIAGRVTVVPNPVADEAKITIAAFKDGQAQWRVLDNTGRTVMQSSLKLKKGTNNLVINVNKLAAGIYFLNVSGGGVNQQVKIQKL